MFVSQPIGVWWKKFTGCLANQSMQTISLDSHRSHFLRNQPHHLLECTISIITDFIQFRFLVSREQLNGAVAPKQLALKSSITQLNRT